MTIPDEIDLLAQLVAIDSSNPGVGEAAVAAALDGLCRELGFATRIVEAAPGRPNLLVTVDAGGGRALGLSGHLDTKPIGEAAAEWRTPPHELVVDGDLGYGLGASDMKGGVAAMVVAARQWADQATRGRLELILTADEEAGSELGAAALAREAALDVEAILIGEPSGVSEPWEAIHVVSRGICCFEVVVEGTQGHSGLSERLPTSATVAAARALTALDGLAPTYPPHPSYDYRPTVNPGVMISGGVFYGVHPGHAAVACDVRVVPGMSRDQLERDVRERLAEVMPGDVRWDLRFRSGQLGWMSATVIEDDHPLVSAARAAAASVLGRDLPLRAYPGATDAAAFNGIAGIPCIASLGPGWLSVAHGPNEHVGLSQVREAVDLYRTLVGSYLGADAPGAAEHASGAEHPAGAG